MDMDTRARHHQAKAAMRLQALKKRAEKEKLRVDRELDRKWSNLCGLPLLRTKEKPEHPLVTLRALPDL